MATRTNKQTNIKKGRINLHLCRPFLTHTPIITSTKGWRGITVRFTSHLGPLTWLLRVQYLPPRNALLKMGFQTQERGSLFETGKSLHPHLHVLAILFPASHTLPSHPIPSVSFYPFHFIPSSFTPNAAPPHLIFITFRLELGFSEFRDDRRVREV